MGAAIPWLLAIVAVCITQCVVQGAALRLARRGRYQQSITLACISNWATLLFGTFVVPDMLPILVLAALMPVAFPITYVRWRRGPAFTVFNGGRILAMGALARFQSISTPGRAYSSLDL